MKDTEQELILESDWWSSLMWQWSGHEDSATASGSQGNIWSRLPNPWNSSHVHPFPEGSSRL